MLVKIRVREIVARLLHELLIPINSLVGSRVILKDKAPREISIPLKALGEASERIWRDAKYLYSYSEQRLELESPVKAAAQIREIVSEWKEYEQTLSKALRQIRTIMALGFRMEDPQLNIILGDFLFNSFEQLQFQIGYLETIEGKNLIFPDREQARVHHHETGRGSPIASTARSFVYELEGPLQQGLEFGYLVLKDNPLQESLAPIDSVGRNAKLFRSEVVNFAEGFMQKTDLTLDEAAYQIRQQVSLWKEHESNLSNSIQEIRQLLTSGLSVDADFEAVIAGAFFNAFKHLERIMRRLETIEAKDL